MERDKENPSLVPSGDREIPTRVATVPVGNDGPEGLGFPGFTAPMIDSFLTYLTLFNYSKYIIYLARYCGLPLATYCKVPPSDVN